MFVIVHVYVLTKRRERIRRSRSRRREKNNQRKDSKTFWLVSKRKMNELYSNSNAYASVNVCVCVCLSQLQLLFANQQNKITQFSCMLSTMEVYVSFVNYIAHSFKPQINFQVIHNTFIHTHHTTPHTRTEHISSPLNLYFDWTIQVGWLMLAPRYC